MAAVTICSDFGAQKNKVLHCTPLLKSLKKHSYVRFMEIMSSTENHLDKDMATRKQKIHLGSINLYVLQGHIFGEYLIETRYFMKIK